MQPTASVIMPIYNGRRYLAEAIASILGQTYTNVDFIIVNDGSQDKSAEIIRTHSESDDRISVISLEKNGGQSAAKNIGNSAGPTRGIFSAPWMRMPFEAMLTSHSLAPLRCPSRAIMASILMPSRVISSTNGKHSM